MPTSFAVVRGNQRGSKWKITITNSSADPAVSLYRLFFGAGEFDLMDRPTQEHHDQKPVDVAGNASLYKGWTTDEILVSYEINSEHHVDHGQEADPGRGSLNGECARSHHLLPSSGRSPPAKPSSLVVDPSSPSISKTLPQPIILVPSCEYFTQHIRMALASAPRRPPVTSATLTELNPHLIFHNISLRCDINFEHDLHFMPVKGKRAEQKRHEAHQYWSALAAELQIHLHARVKCSLHHSCRYTGHGAFSPRLPQMFTDLRELLETLVPDSDHGTIVENMDVPFLMQQIENGVLDIVRLAKWLTSLLKMHCAPMRDHWADQMMQQIEDGSQQSDVVELVKGISRLFSVLEAMKLDVANHQIRTFRYYLIEDTLPFQQRLFARRIADGKVDVGQCRDWYTEAKRQYFSCPFSTNAIPTGSDTYTSLIHGVITTFITAFEVGMLPQSFHFDLKRLERIRSDIEDLVHLRMGIMVFDELCFAMTSNRISLESREIYSELQSRILAIVDSQAEEDAWQASSSDVALEIARAACKFSELSDVAVPDCLIQMTHLRLEELSCAQAPEYGIFRQSLQRELTSRAIHHGHLLNDLTPLAMSESQQQWRRQQEQKSTLGRLPDMEDIARQLAHLLILHWKVWANLVYVSHETERSSPEIPSVVSLRSNIKVPNGVEIMTSSIASAVGTLVE